MSKLHELHRMGQSTWLNYMRRDFIKSGGLRQAIADGIQGVTANAAVFAHTIANYDDYDEAIHEQVRAGTPYRHIHEMLMMDDARGAADMLHTVYEESEGWDGFASMEMDPSLAHSGVKTAATARHMLSGMDRGNTMVEIPGTPEGCEAIESLVTDCESLNVTHIFTVTDFERAAQAYIAGLETLFASHSMWRITPTAVASFSVGAIDEAVDPALREQGADHLCGKTGIAMAKLLFERYQQIFSGPRWERLSRRKARPMRPKWTRTTPRDGERPLTYYANALIGADTILTFTPETMAAFEAEGVLAFTLTHDMPQARAHLANLSAVGVDLDELVHGLQADHLTHAAQQYDALIEAVTQKLYVVGMQAE